MNDARVRECEVWATTKTYRKKVDSAVEHLLRGASKGRMFVSTSWGKDSIALCDLAIRALPAPVTLFHMSSPYSLPGYDDTIAHFSARANVVTHKATRTLLEYIELCRDIGLPHERSRSEQSRVITSIKRGPAAEFAAEHGFAVQALGLRIEEHGPREFVLKSRGPVYQIADESWRCCPLIGWSSRDVWAYIFANGLPYNRRIYDAETHGLTRFTIRNTGWLSTDGAHYGRIAWLRTHFPDEYRLLYKDFPAVASLT